MKKIDLSTHTVWLFILFSSCLLVFGHIFVLQRIPDSPNEYLTIRDDTLEYIKMTEGNYELVNSPLKYRILLPFIASLLPFTAEESLKIISYLSLFGFYIVIIQICLKLGLNKFSSILGVICAFATLSHLYNYHNPFLTDAFGLLVISLVIYAYLTDSFILFSSVCFVGLFARETIIFLAPLWMMKSFRRGIIVTALSLFVLVIPRVDLITGSGQHSLFFFLTSIGIEKFNSLLSTMLNVFDTFGFLWFVMIIGFRLIESEKMKDIKIIFLSLILGAIIATAIATDTVRMFSILFPIIAITVAKFITVIIQKELKSVLVLLIIFTAIQLLTSIPNIVFDENSFIFSNYLLRNIISLTGLIYCIVCTIILRKEMFKDYRRISI